MKQSELTDLYPALASLPVDQLASFAATSAPLHLPAGTVLFDEHSPCQGFPLVLEGRVRVTKPAPATDKGAARELHLYRLNPGEICLLSTGCLLAGTNFSARGVTETAVSLVLLPPAVFDEFTRHTSFRHFVFGQFSERLQDLMALVEAVAFQRLDQRLANALLGRGRILHVTHQQLADELGTIREMVTRVLGRFEEAGAVLLSREKIEILDPTRLRQIAEHGM